MRRTVPHLTERIFPENLLPAENSWAIKRCAICYKQKKRRDIAL
jgi:hypothetical protein